MRLLSMDALYAFGLIRYILHCRTRRHGMHGTLRANRGSNKKVIA